MTTAEQWKPIPGFDGYEVSSLGRVLSTVRRIPRILSQKEQTPGGYPQVALQAPDGRRVTRLVHRLVAEAFHGPCPQGQEVLHIDGNRQNPHADNLRWGTRADNMQDQVRHGVHVQAKKTSCPSGHPYDEANTYRIPSRPTARYCRACQVAHKAAYAARSAFRAAGIAA